MAGKRHHFIPQFLQKGFASHTVGDEAFTWVYRKGAEPFNPNIKNIGVEGYFYSEDNDFSLDNSITNAEYLFSGYLINLREDNIVNQKDSELIGRIFAHLEARTRHMRHSMLNAGNYMLNELIDYLSKPDSLEKFVRNTLANDPLMEDKVISKELEKRGISQELLPIFRDSCEPLIEQHISKLLNDMSGMFVYLKKEMPTRLKQASKSGHIDALKKTLAPESKVKLYETLTYKIFDFEEDGLLLGDSAVLFNISGERAFKTFLDKGDELIAVILPISASQVLVGSRKNYSIDLSTLREEIAACSLEYFIASKNSPENAKLSDSISMNAHFLSNNEIEKMIYEMINPV